jgi:hypothetical protein
MSFSTEQEKFWANEFGDDYISRNISEQLLASNVSYFAKALARTQKISSLIELGANVGMNIGALKTLLPNSKMTAVEINQQAATELSNRHPDVDVRNESILDNKNNNNALNDESSYREEDIQYDKQSYKQIYKHNIKNKLQSAGKKRLKKQQKHSDDDKLLHKYINKIINKENENEKDNQKDKPDKEMERFKDTVSYKLISIMFDWYERILDCINLLGKYQIVHNDLKYNNVLINRETITPIVIDFGLSIYIKHLLDNPWREKNETGEEINENTLKPSSKGNNNNFYCPVWFATIKLPIGVKNM